MELTLSQIVLFYHHIIGASYKLLVKKHTQFCNHLKFISLIRSWCFNCSKKFFDICINNFISRIYYFQLFWSNTIYWTWIPKLDSVIKIENCVYLIVSTQNTTLWILEIQKFNLKNKQYTLLNSPNRILSVFSRFRLLEINNPHFRRGWLCSNSRDNYNEYIYLYTSAVSLCLPLVTMSLKLKYVLDRYTV